MAGVYNRFEIKLDNNIFVEKVKETAEKLFRETNFKMQNEFLIWDNIDINGVILSAEVYCGAEDGDLEKSRDLFEMLCKKIAADYMMLNFMGRHTYDFANTDTTDYMLCFRKNSVLQFYQAEVVEDVGCMNAKRHSLNYSFLKFELKDEFVYEDLYFGNEENSNNDFMKVLEGYNSSKYPKPPKKNSQKDQLKKDSTKTAKKPKYEKGKYYRIRYILYGKEKELIGQLETQYSKTYGFKTFGDEVVFIEDPDIKIIKEVFETEETRKLTADYEDTGAEIESAEWEMKKLREEFYSLYATEGDSWKKTPLEKVDIGQSYPGVRGIQAGATYLVKIKEGTSEVGTDIVLTIDHYEDAFGGGFRVMGCVPGICKSDIAMIRPIVVWNQDEFTDEVLPSKAGLEIQKKRMELYDSINEFHAKRNQLKKDYMDSFKE